jgi:hypothetical protein
LDPGSPMSGPSRLTSTTGENMHYMIGAEGFEATFKDVIIDISERKCAIDKCTQSLSIGCGLVPFA